MVRLTDRPDMTLDVYRGRKTTIQYNRIQALFSSKDKSKKNSVVCCKFLFGALLVKVMCSLLPFRPEV